MGRLSSEMVDCPHCGRELAYGAWDHINRCAKRRQQEIEQAEADRKAKPLEDFLKKEYGVTFIDVTDKTQ